MNSAIIVAAGRGSRFGSDTPKQFISLLGKPIVEHTVERFQQCASINEIVLVLPEAELERFRSVDLAARVKLVAGGDTRTRSVRNGLAAVDPTAGVVAIHDGARPLVTTAEIEATIAAAAEKGAACLVALVTDTIKTVEGNEITRTLDRDRLRRALTPQAFRIEVIRAALDAAGDEAAATDESYLVEQLGHPVVTVEGSARNIKITTAEDLAIAEALLSCKLS